MRRDSGKWLGYSRARTLGLAVSTAALLALLASCGRPGGVTNPGLPGPGSDVTVAVAGDVACDPTVTTYPSDQCHSSQTASIVQAMDPQAVLMLGDGQYEDGTLSKYQQAYDATWGQFKGMTFPTVGNHDYRTQGASGYAGYFGSRAVRNGTYYYSFDIGSWHAVVLDSNCVQSSDFPEAPSCAAGSAQEQWLRSDLAANQTQCTLAIWHQPYASSGNDGDHALLQPLFQDLYDAGVEILLSGHDHDYERFQPEDPNRQVDAAAGVTQFVVGTGGFSHTSAGSNPTASPSAVVNYDTYGVMRLTLRSDGYDWQFVPDTSSGSFTDSGSASCH